MKYGSAPDFCRGLLDKLLQVLFVLEGDFLNVMVIFRHTFLLYCWCDSGASSGLASFVLVVYWSTGWLRAGCVLVE